MLRRNPSPLSRTSGDRAALRYSPSPRSRPRPPASASKTAAARVRRREYAPETALPPPANGAKPDLAFGAFQRGYFVTAFR